MITKKSSDKRHKSGAFFVRRGCTTVVVSNLLATFGG
jgi:hypothetical protein